jgi:hypothetical protein
MSSYFLVVDVPRPVRLEVPLKKIRAKRNRVLAHSDPTIILDPAKLTKAVELSYSDLDVIFTVTGRIFAVHSVIVRKNKINPTSAKQWPQVCIKTLRC